jgi:hydroxyacylglutathione hydrolase
MTDAAVHRIPALSDNYIWLYEYAPGVAAAVDPAEAGPVLAALSERGLRLTHILNTHWHPDHVGGNLQLKQELGCTIIGPRREQEKIPGLDRAVDDGDTLDLGGRQGRVLFVGAHTAGHIAYWFEAAAILFPGDTLFAMGCGRLFEGTPADMFAALSRLAALPADTLVYCAHEYTLSNARFAITVEPDNAALAARKANVEAQRATGDPTVPFPLSAELETNPFVRAQSVEQLAERRQAKDRF